MTPIGVVFIVVVGLAQSGAVLDTDSDLDHELNLHPVLIKDALTHLNQLSYPDVQTALNALHPIVRAHCVAQSPRLASLGVSTSAQAALNRLLDPETPLDRFCDTIQALWSMTKGTLPLELEQALCRVPLADAAAIYERLADDCRLKLSFRNKLIAYLVALPYQTVFLSVVVDGIVHVTNTGSATSRHSLPPILINGDITARQQRARDVRHALRPRSNRLPQVVIRAVQDLALLCQIQIGGRCFPDDELKLVRNHFPKAFRDVFPFNSLISDLLFNELRGSGLLLDADLVLDLAHLGIRFDLRHYLDLGLDLDNPVLTLLVPLLRPSRHLFDGIGRPLTRCNPMWSECIRYMSCQSETDTDGNALYMCNRRHYLEPLLGMRSFVSHLRRHPDQLYGALAALIARGHMDVVDRLAQHPVLARPEFAIVAQSLLVFLLHQRQLQVSDAAVLALLVLPLVNLYERTPYGAAPVALLSNAEAEFATIISNAEFRRRVAHDPSPDLSALNYKTRAFVVKLQKVSKRQKLKEKNSRVLLALHDLMGCGR